MHAFKVDSVKPPEGCLLAVRKAVGKQSVLESKEHAASFDLSRFQGNNSFYAGPVCAAIACSVITSDKLMNLQ